MAAVTMKADSAYSPPNAPAFSIGDDQDGNENYGMVRFDLEAPENTLADHAIDLAIVLAPAEARLLGRMLIAQADLVEVK